MFLDLQRLDPPIHDSMHEVTDAKIMWDSLQTRFSIPNRPRIYKLHSDIALTKQDEASVLVYYSKLLGMWGELSCLTPIESCKCPAGVDKLKRDEDTRTYQFLIGLDDMYSTLRTNITNTDPFPTLDRVYAMVMQEESHRGLTGTRDTPSAVGF